MPSPELTIAVSIGGSIAVAALPKLIDLFLGEKIAKRKDETDQRKAQLAAEEAYRQAVFTAAREDAAASLKLYRDRVRELEALLGRSLDETHPGVSPPTNREEKEP